MTANDLAAGAHLLAVVLVAAPLVYAAMGKLSAPSEFLMALPRLHVNLPPRPASAATVGVVELAIGAALLLVVRWESAVVCGVAYLALGAVVARARRLGASGDCGCFGALPSKIDGPSVLRNIGLGMATLVIGLGRGLGMLSGYDTSIALAASVSMVLGAAAVDTLLFVRPRLRR